MSSLNQQPIPPLLFPPDITAYMLQFFPSLHWNSLLTALASPPTMTTYRVTIPSKTEVLDNEDYDSIASRRLSFVTTLLQKVLDDQCEERRWDRMNVIPHPVLKDVLCVPVNGPFEVEPQDKEIVIDIHTGHAVLRGADIYAPGVLAMQSNVNKSDKVAVMVDVDGTCIRGHKLRFQGNKVFIGNGRMEMNRLDIFRADPSTLSGIGVRMLCPLYRTPSWSAIEQAGLESLLFLQNSPSVLAGRVLGVRPGDYVLDMCASPGGKTTHLAAQLLGLGLVVALDRTRAKIKRIEHTALTCGVAEMIRCLAIDATKAVAKGDGALGREDLKNIVNGTKVKGFRENIFDCVLVDPPCSGLGQRPSFRSNITHHGVTTDHPAYQRRLLRSAIALLKEGGSLVYSTCTINPSENEQIIAWIIQAFPDMYLVDPEICMGGPGLHNAGLDNSQCALVRRFDPTIEKDCIGFFIAKVRKRISSG